MFDVAESLGIPKLLDVEDMKYLEKKSIILYTSQFVREWGQNPPEKSPIPDKQAKPTSSQSSTSPQPGASKTISPAPPLPPKSQAAPSQKAESNQMECAACDSIFTVKDKDELVPLCPKCCDILEALKAPIKMFTILESKPQPQVVNIVNLSERK